MATQNFKNSYVALIVFLLENAGLDDFLRPFRGSPHPAWSLNASHSNTSPYWAPAPGQADGDRAAEEIEPRPPSFWKEALTSVSQDGVAFGAMVSFCDSHWAHRVFLLRSCCSILSVPFLSVQVQLVVWRSLWFWHSLSIKFLDSVCCSVLSGLLLALLLIDCPLQTCVIHSFIHLFPPPFFKKISVLFLLYPIWCF